jgi:hypothetical protein
MPQKLFDDEIVPGQWYDANLYWPPGMIANPDSVSIDVLTAVWNQDTFRWMHISACLWYNTKVMNNYWFWSRPDGAQNVQYWQVPIDPPIPVLKK